MPQHALKDDLNDLFAQRLADSREFRSWLLSRTKFARLWPLARLLRGEQKAMNWQEPWWWNAGAGAGAHPATDMMFVFEIDHTVLRFALHVENACCPEDLAAFRAGGSRDLAQAMMKQDSFLNYTDFETVLLAPQSLIDNARQLDFDCMIAHESVAGFLPEFAPIRAAA